MHYNLAAFLTVLVVSSLYATAAANDDFDRRFDNALRIAADHPQDWRRIRELLHRGGWQPVNGTRLASEINLDRPWERQVYLFAAPAMFLPTVHVNRKDFDGAEDGARVLVYRMVSDAEFRIAYLRLVHWTQYLIVPPEHEIWDQGQAIYITMSAIAERFRDGDNRYYWQDTLVFICVALTMGSEVPFGMPLEFADVRAQVAEFMDWLEGTKFTASAERCGWEPSQDGATLLNLPPVDLPAAPFDNFKDDEREGHSWEDWRNIWFKAYIVY